MQIDLIKSKIYLLPDLLRAVHVWKFKGDKIVFTNGCFDLIHPGHIHTLTSAADFGKKLIVALNTDSSVKKLKGSSRPLQNENSRALIMASFDFVDAIILFNEETPIELIKSIQPDVLVKGGDYKKENIVGNTEMLSWNGSIEVIPFLKGFSTSSIEEKIRK